MIEFVVVRLSGQILLDLSNECCSLIRFEFHDDDDAVYLIRFCVVTYFSAFRIRIAGRSACHVLVWLCFLSNESCSIIWFEFHEAENAVYLIRSCVVTYFNAFRIRIAGRSACHVLVWFFLCVTLFCVSLFFVWFCRTLNFPNYLYLV